MSSFAATAAALALASLAVVATDPRTAHADRLDDAAHVTADLGAEDERIADAIAVAKPAIAAAAVAIAKQAASNNSRAVATGLTMGYYGGATVSPGRTAVHGMAFGLAVYTFKRSSVGVGVEDILEARLKAAIEAEAERILARGGTPVFMLIARQLVGQIKEELLGEVAPPALLQRPSRALIVEALIQVAPVFGGGLRLGATQGIGPISVGLGAGFLRSQGETVPFVGADLSLRLTPAPTAVFDGFARFDVGFAENDRTLTVIGGVRMFIL